MKKNLIRLSILTFLIMSTFYLSINTHQFTSINAIYETEEVINEHFFVTNETDRNKYSETWDFQPNAELNVTISLDSNSSSNIDLIYYNLESLDSHNITLTPGESFYNSTKSPAGYDIVFVLGIFITLSSNYINASGNIEIDILNAGGLEPIFIGIEFLQIGILSVFIFSILFILKKRRQ